MLPAWISIALGLAAATAPCPADAGFYQITTDAIVRFGAIPNATGYDQQTNGATLLLAAFGLALLMRRMPRRE